MADDTGNGRAETETGQPKRPLSPRGSSVSANGSATSKGPARQVEAWCPVRRADPSALARGFRLSTELVAGVLVGAFIGWLLDGGSASRRGG